MQFWSIFAQRVRAPHDRFAVRAREIFIHDGRAMRRLHISASSQIGALSGALLLIVTALFGIFQAIVGVPAITGAISGLASREQELARLEAQVASLRGEVATIRTSATAHVARLEARQASLAALMNGERAPAGTVAIAVTDGAVADRQIDSLFDGVEQEQRRMADAMRARTELENRKMLAAVTRLGIAPTRLRYVSGGGMGGPFEPAPAAGGEARRDPHFKALFDSMRQRDELQLGMVAIPSARPVETVTVNSGFGVRSDPFRGGRAMHAGVDMPGPVGTKIYATADGRVGRAGWYGGYGNLVELEHGRGIQTRYGHLSSILVAPGTRVKRGQLIGLMGSTGRSTGSHLHYEVRIDGRAVNPIPFLQTSDYLLAMSKRPSVAVGGPVEPVTSK